MTDGGTEIALLARRWVRIGLTWLLGPWLARPILARAHRQCLQRCRRLEWEVLTKPALRSLYATSPTKYVQMQQPNPLTLADVLSQQNPFRPKGAA